MTNRPTRIPLAPALLVRSLGVLPLGPLSVSMTAYARKIARNNPGLFRRLGAYDHFQFVLDPTDLPIVICLEPKRDAPRITLKRRTAMGDVTIAGPLAALLGLVHGTFDGDALFFSRDLLIRGDTAAALALRNAVDDAELDLGLELAALVGPLSAPLRQFYALIERRTGVSLTRGASPVVC